MLSRRTLPGLPSGQVGKPEPKWSWREHALPVTDIDVTSGGLQVMDLFKNKVNTLIVIAICMVQGTSKTAVSKNLC